MLWKGYEMFPFYIFVFQSFCFNLTFFVIVVKYVINVVFSFYVYLIFSITHADLKPMQN